MARFDVIKGSKFDLTKENQGLNEIEVKLAWKGSDIDASTFLLGKDGVIIDDADFVYFKSKNREGTFDEYLEKIKKDGRWSENTPVRKRPTRVTWMKDTRPMSSDGSLLGSIDDLGSEEDASEESDETINVTLESVNPSIQEIVFVVTVYNAPDRPLSEQVTFGQIIDTYILITNIETGEEILKYAIDEKFNKETGVEVARLFRQDGEWSFEAVGEGYDGGLQYFVELYS